MMRLYAQPYDISAVGFYFETVEQFEALFDKAVNEHGQPVEEFEIQFIDGEEIDCALAEAWGLDQVSLGAFFEAVSDWEDDAKVRYIIAVGEGGYSHAQVAGDPDAVELDIYPVESLRELAEQFVDEGLFGEIPKALQYYIDYNAIARDLAMDYTQTTIGGNRLVYRCG